MSQAFAKNLIEKALYECMHVEHTEDPRADHARRVEIWMRAMRTMTERCGEIAEGYAAEVGMIDPQDNEICDGICVRLQSLLAPKTES